MDDADLGKKAKKNPSLYIYSIRVYSVKMIEISFVFCRCICTLLIQLKRNVFYTITNNFFLFLFFIYFFKLKGNKLSFFSYHFCYVFPNDYSCKFQKQRIKELWPKNISYFAIKLPRWQHHIDMMDRRDLYLSIIFFIYYLF